MIRRGVTACFSFLKNDVSPYYSFLKIDVSSYFVLERRNLDLVRSGLEVGHLLSKVGWFSSEIEIYFLKVRTSDNFCMGFG